ncbi:MAG: EndoU domain-containing protein [Granulosicoccus sp.]|nr:EndoU domain-containing protein [Granulosicoccus sp.]
MKRYKRYIPIIAVILVALGVNLDQFGIDLNALSRGANGSATDVLRSDDSHAFINAGDQAPGEVHKDYAQWSKTDPNINQWHIFYGEINRSGKPVGYHARPGGRDPAGARVKSIRDLPNRAGVYTAAVEIHDGEQWRGKFSSFFPDSLSHEEVLQAVLNAYSGSPDPQAQPFEGPSGLGFTIQGYTSSRGGINTAFPIYVRSQ